MRPTKLRTNFFHELPPILDHYLQADRNLWLEGNPKRGRISLLKRSGSFTDLEAQAVERRNLIQLLGLERTRSLRYRTGFEQGRRDGARHFHTFGENGRLALQAALVFGQLQGKFIGESVKFEYDRDERTLYREITFDSCVEAVIHRMTLADQNQCACWNVAGYIAGHTSEILALKAITLETECVCNGGKVCRLVTKLVSEWGPEADWVHEAMTMEGLDTELERRNKLLDQAQKTARRSQSALSELSQRIRTDLLLENIVADSDAMQPVVRRAQQLVSSDIPMIIIGEAGTGKHTLARSIHYGGAKKKKPMVSLDTEGLSAKQIDQELFGIFESTSGDSDSQHECALARSIGGTLFIDEIAGSSYETQGKLLSFLEEGSYLPAGGEISVAADVRIIVGTVTNPEEAVEQGQLREDLLYALAPGRIDVPPLRERSTDIIRLAEEFITEFRKKYERQQVAMSHEFKQTLLNGAWSGNLRQLKSVIEHAVIMTNGNELSPADLPDEVLASRRTDHTQVLTEAVVRATLKRSRNNRTEAADLLGVGRTTLWRAMKRLGID
jgi:DNA-binding NtrC family response regulator